MATLSFPPLRLKTLSLAWPLLFSHKQYLVIRLISLVLRTQSIWNRPWPLIIYCYHHLLCLDYYNGFLTVLFVSTHVPIQSLLYTFSWEILLKCNSSHVVLCTKSSNNTMGFNSPLILGLHVLLHGSHLVLLTLTVIKFAKKQVSGGPTVFLW